jgi:hypothetical protein
MKNYKELNIWKNGIELVKRIYTLFETLLEEEIKMVQAFIKRVASSYQPTAKSLNS